MEQYHTTARKLSPLQIIESSLGDTMRELTQEVELAVVKEVVGLLLQPQLLTQVRHVQQLQNTSIARRFL